MAGCPHPVSLAPLPAAESPFENRPPLSSTPIVSLWQRTMAHIEAASGWLNERELNRYLNMQPFATIPDCELLERESRFHVGIDSRFKRPHQGDTGGHLFQIEFVRLQPGVGLWAEVDGVTLNDEGLLQIGGEGKAATYRKVANELPLTGCRTMQGRFKLYFATPAYFAQGWQPDNWGRFITGGEVQLIAAAIPRAQPIGGFDIARGQHKPMRSYVPAGSVYFFEAEDDVIVPDILTDEGGQIGFGQVFIGRWEYV